MSEEKQMTVDEALAAGYVWCSNEDGESFGKIETMTEETFNWGGNYYLAEKDSFTFSLSASTIQELIADHLSSQDEVYDEDMPDFLDAVDFEAVAALINPCFTKKYHIITEIRLIQNPTQP
jgi:hypothetical protein